MDTTTHSLPFSDAIPADVTADLEAVTAALAAGKKVAPEIAQRVRDRAARITADVRRVHGVLDIGVPAIRALRDGDIG